LKVSFIEHNNIPEQILKIKRQVAIKEQRPIIIITRVWASFLLQKLFAGSQIYRRSVWHGNRRTHRYARTQIRTHTDTHTHRRTHLSTDKRPSHKKK